LALYVIVGMALWGSGLGVFGSTLKASHAAEAAGWLMMVALYLAGIVTCVVQDARRTPSK
jgi:hypothetical protein